MKKIPVNETNGYYRKSYYALREHTHNDVSERIDYFDPDEDE
jgi:hypothetical protein